MVKVVITYRHEGRDEYLSLIHQAIESAHNFGYEVVTVGSDAVMGDYHINTPEGQEPFLCNWILMAQQCYLESSLFDCNSVIFSPDALFLKPIDKIFELGFDLAVTERNYQKDKINNGVMFITPDNKQALIRMWGELREMAGLYKGSLQKWGSDQRSLNEYLTLHNDKPDGLRVMRLPCCLYNADPKDVNTTRHAYIVHFKGSKKEMMNTYRKNTCTASL